MGRLGFTPAEGPEIEDEHHNFEALNIPRIHPARDPLDNFYLSVAEGYSEENPILMRSQTSTVQIRVMENTPPPVRIISLGRVYRPDKPDDTHFPMFHQIEGLYVDRHVTMADLKSVLRFVRYELSRRRRTRSVSSLLFPLHRAQCRSGTTTGTTRGLNSAAPAWSIPTCSKPSGTIPKMSPGSPLG